MRLSTANATAPELACGAPGAVQEGEAVQLARFLRD